MGIRPGCLEEAPFEMGLVGTTGMGSLLCHLLPAACPAPTQLFVTKRSKKCSFLVSHLLSVFSPLGCKQGGDTLSVSSTTISPEPRTVPDT